MGNYKEKLDWKPEQLTTWASPQDNARGGVAWNGAGLVDTDFARAFASDLLKKCDLVDKMNAAAFLQNTQKLPIPAVSEVIKVLKIAEEALEHHTSQTRPLLKTDEALTDIKGLLTTLMANQGILPPPRHP